MQIKNDERLNAEKKRRNIIIEAFCQSRKMEAKDWKHLFLLVVSFLPGRIWKLVNPHIWVVSEYSNLARDNGYWFFRYLRTNHKDLDVFYPLANDSPDKMKIQKLGGIVEFSSFKHFLLFWASEKQFTSSKNAGFPSRICEDLVQWNLHGFQYILLNHGITRGKSTVVDANKTNFDYICTCSFTDKEIIVKDNNQPADKVKVTGFARHDNLNDDSELEKLIVVMPTWRKQFDIKFETNRKKENEIVNSFMKSGFYEKYMELLNEERLIYYLEKKNFKLVFYLHDYAQKFSVYFHSKCKNVIIATENNFDIQDLLKRGSLLITDYSSVCYDFAYMYKPVLYYQFDTEWNIFKFFQSYKLTTVIAVGLKNVFDGLHKFTKLLINF